MVPAKSPSSLSTGSPPSSPPARRSYGFPSGGTRRHADRLTTAFPTASSRLSTHHHRHLAPHIPSPRPEYYPRNEVLQVRDTQSSAPPLRNPPAPTHRLTNVRASGGVHGVAKAVIRPQSRTQRAGRLAMESLARSLAGGCSARQHHELARGQTKGCCMLQDVHHHASGNVSRMGPSVPTQSVHTLM